MEQTYYYKTQGSAIFLFAVNDERFTMLVHDENGCNFTTAKFDAMEGKNFSRENYSKQIQGEKINEQKFIEKLKELKNNPNYFKMFEALNIGEVIN